MIHFILAVGLLAGLFGWYNPNPETRGMSRFLGLIAGAVAFVYWAPALVHWGLG